jgi:hypothetical protein
MKKNPYFTSAKSQYHAAPKGAYLLDHLRYFYAGRL